MAKVPAQADVLVLGEHPSAYLAAALLRVKTKLKVVQACVPGPTWPDHLVRLNPDLFDLHPLLAPLKRKLDVTATYGLQFLSEDGTTRSEYRSKSTIVGVTSYKGARTATQAIAQEQGVELLTPKSLDILQLDEEGADVAINGSPLRVRALITSATLPDAQRRLLALPEGWDDEVVYRYTWVRLRGKKSVSTSPKPTIATSLDLGGQTAIGWLLVNATNAEIGVYEKVQAGRATAADALLRKWASVLEQHEVLKESQGIPFESAQSLELPLAGALAQEGMGNRTLMVGPAGGFISATGEDLYPGCWSAVHAAEVMKKALKEPHLQDALNAYRARWRTTLGDYLRGPQQNLRFLLPLVYRNEVMSERLAEAILRGKSVVR